MMTQYGTPLLIHSDRGSQYTSQALQERGIQQSMNLLVHAVMITPNNNLFGHGSRKRRLSHEYHKLYGGATQSGRISLFHELLGTTIGFTLPSVAFPLSINVNSMEIIRLVPNATLHHYPLNIQKDV